jgi:tetratricopeptide (TPR) repeat protein
VPRGRAEDKPAPLQWPGFGQRVRLVTRIGIAGLLGAAAVSVVLLFLSDFYIREARDEQGKSASKQLSAAQTAADLDPVSVIPLYLQASALEAEGERSHARDVLQDALSKEPNNFVTLTLLGDLQVRDGEFDDAAGYYKKASDLNPRDTGLQQLAEQTAATATPEAAAAKKKQPKSG